MGISRLKLSPPQQLSLALLTLDVQSRLPVGFGGYAEMLNVSDQPPPCAVEWLKRIETVLPGTTKRYWDIFDDGPVKLPD